MEFLIGIAGFLGFLLYLIFSSGMSESMLSRSKKRNNNGSPRRSSNYGDDSYDDYSYDDDCGGSCYGGCVDYGDDD